MNGQNTIGAQQVTALEEKQIGESTWLTRWSDGAVSLANFPGNATIETHGGITTWERWFTSVEDKRAVLDMLQASLAPVETATC